MARAESRYVCQSCGEAFLRWEGQCRACGGWNSLVETVVRSPGRAERAKVRVTGPRTARPPRRWTRSRRRPSRAAPIGIGELDRVLGGGLVAGAVVLLGGEPGIGKSTLLLQSTAGLVGDAGSAGALYATGEESASQVRLRAARLGLLDGDVGARIRILAENDIDRVIEAARAEPPAVLVVDSVQTAMVADLDGRAGQRRPGPRVDAPADGLREGGGDRGHPRRPRHQGRLDRRPQDPRAPRRRRPEPRRRADVGAAPAARHQEPLRVHRGGRRLRDGASAAWPRSPTRPARSSPTTTSRRRAASSPRRSRAAGRCWSRSRRWSPPRATARRPGGPAGSTRTGSACCWRSWAGARASASRATTSMPTSPAG